MPVLLPHQYHEYNVDYENYNQVDRTVQVVISIGKRRHLVADFISDFDDAELRAHSFIAARRASMKIINVTGINVELYAMAKQAAHDKAIPIGEWINDAINDKLILDGNITHGKYMK